MPCLRQLLAGLMLFCFTAAYHGIATPEQVEKGQVEGFTGLSDVEPTGDWLTATFCYCKYPPKVDSSSGLAHWYQFEYYSKHSHNTTFILTSNCPSDYERTGVDCVPESGNDVLAGDSVGHKLCRTWPGKEDNTDQKKPHDNKLCYLPFEEDGDDFIEFNGEQRNLSPRGGQRPIRENQTAADEVCKGMCQEHLSMELLIHPHKMPSHQVTWTDLDDMCDTCE